MHSEEREGIYKSWRGGWREKSRQTQGRRQRRVIERRKFWKDGENDYK